MLLLLLLLSPLWLVGLLLPLPLPLLLLLLLSPLWLVRLLLPLPLPLLLAVVGVVVLGLEAQGQQVGHLSGRFERRRRLGCLSSLPPPPCPRPKRPCFRLVRVNWVRGHRC